MVLRRIDDRPDFCGVETMKDTKKQKLRKKEEKERRAVDRRYAVLERLLNLFGLKGLFCPLDWMTKAEAAIGINPGFEVQIAEDSQDDPDLEEARALCERVVGALVPFTIDDRVVELSLDDICRGFHTVPAIVRFVHDVVSRRRMPASEASFARLEEAKKRVEEFGRTRLYNVFGRLVRRLNLVADEFLRIDEKVIWHRIERNERYPDRTAFRVILGRKRQVPVSLPVAEGRRRAYPCAGPYRSPERRATSRGTQPGLESERTAETFRYT